MYHVISIPLLGIELNISPIAFEIAGIPIYWYAIFIVSAFIIALILFKKQDGLFQIAYKDVLDLSIYLIPSCIIGARLYYIMFHLDYYLQNPTQIISIRAGGLAIYGGILAGLMVILLFCKKRRINVWNLLDYIVPSLALGQCIGRWGNFMNAEAYGTQTKLLWKMGILKENGFEYVHPTFLYESIITLLLFLYLNKKKKNRKWEGELTYSYIIIYSFARMFIEGLRIDSLMLEQYRISQVLSVIFFVVFGGIFLYKIRICRKMSKN